MLDSNILPLTFNTGQIRQAIVDRSQSLFAWKVLSKGGLETLIRRVDVPPTPEQQSQKISTPGNLQPLACGRKCFINFDRQALLNQAYKSFDSDTTVVEVSGTERLDSEFINACLGVTQNGYSLALDDFVAESHQQPLLEHIDLLNVEFPALTEDQHRRIVESSLRYGFIPLAERVDSQEDFESARELGYTYFQGNYYSRPKKKVVRRLQPSQLNYLRLLDAVNSSDFQLDTVESLIRQDTALTVRLLQFLNSPAFGLRTQINSIRHAIGVLGQRPLQKWISLIAVGELSREKPLILMTTSLVRARFCESIAEKTGKPIQAGECFLIGMLSLLDALLDQPMTEAISNLALSQTITASLLNQQSELSYVLDMIRALEEADWQWLRALAFQSQAEESVLFQEYERAIQWAGEVTAGMS